MTDGFVGNRYGRIVSDLPTRLHDGAYRLPHLLGLVETENGTWDDYSRVRFAHDLPGAVFPDLLPSLEELELEEFRLLHLTIASSFVIEDRIADGDIPRDPFLEELSRVFKVSALDRLRRIGPETGADALSACLQRWTRAVEREQEALSRRKLGYREYGRCIVEKNHYLTLATRIGLVRSGIFSPPLDSLLDGMLVALQCRSDALEHRKDRDHRGASFPELLGCSGAVLYDASSLMMEILRSFSLRSGLPHLSSCIDEGRNDRFPGDVWPQSDRNRTTSALVALTIFPDLATMN